VLGYGLDNQGFELWQGLRIFLFTTASYPMGTGGLGWAMKLTTHLHLVPRSRMHGAIPPLPQYAFMVWCSVKTQGQLYIYIQMLVYYCELHFEVANLGAWFCHSNVIYVPETTTAI
jgi:hypothetical protein